VYVISTALVPGKVQNLRSTLDITVPTLTLHWDKPKNITTDGDVKSYDIRFKPCGREGNYCKKTVVAPATSILLTRESGLKPMTKYDFEIRAQNSYREGKWTKHSKYIGKFYSLYIMLLKGTALAIREGEGYTLVISHYAIKQRISLELADIFGMSQ